MMEFQKIIQTSNDYNKAPAHEFGRQYPWTVAFVILFAAMIAGFLAIGHINSRQQADREERISNDARIDRQFCVAIPEVAAASAEALVNTARRQAIRNNSSSEELEELNRQGVIYIAEARQLAESKLPSCPRILKQTP